MEKKTKDDIGPGVGVSVLANVGDDRQFTLQTWFDRDTTVAEGTKVLNFLNALIDAQKAPHEIKALEKEKVELEGQLERLDANLKMLGENYEKRRAARLIEVSSINALVDERTKAAQQAWSRAGKAGEYKPGNQILQLEARAQALREKAAEDNIREEEERNGSLAEMEVNRKRFQSEVEHRTARIAELRVKLAASSEPVNEE